MVVRMDTILPAPRIESRLELSDGLSLTPPHPDLISRATEIDQQMVASRLHAFAANSSMADSVVKA